MHVTAAKNTRRAFDNARGNLWSFDPHEICIEGGACIGNVDERGPLDTEIDRKHALRDIKRLKKPLSEEFVASIDAHGVHTPILIIKLDGVAKVVAGRRRLRGARAVNARRKKAGLPLIKIDCKLIREGDVGQRAAMILENEGREDNDLETKIEQLKEMMSMGVSVEDCVPHFAKPVAVLKGWLLFDDNATTETKAAASAGRLSVSAAAELAKITDPDAQRERLTQLISSGEKITVHKAKAAARIARGKGVGVSDKKTQKSLLAIVQGTPHPNVSEKTAAWWEGAEEMLKLLMGADDVDQRLQSKLDEAIALRKTEKRAKAKKSN
jgi:ParB-like chromosome segregation protein Spo0J